MGEPTAVKTCRCGSGGVKADTESVRDRASRVTRIIAVAVVFFVVMVLRTGGESTLKIGDTSFFFVRRNSEMRSRNNIVSTVVCCEYCSMTRFQKRVSKNAENTDSTVVIQTDTC